MAFVMGAELAKVRKGYVIDMEDAVVVTEDDKGKLQAALSAAQKYTLAWRQNGRVKLAPPCSCIHPCAMTQSNVALR